MMKALTKHLGGFMAAGLVAGLLCAPTAQAVTVGVEQSGGPWGTFMNVTELPANGGGYVFGSGWGIPDLAASFDDGANTLTMSPNTIGDPNEFWYQDTCACAADPVNPGGPGQAGNKIMEANLYIEMTDVFNGQTLTFEGTVLSNTLTGAHTSTIFIRDFAPDYSSFNETAVPATPGPFSISLAADPGAGRHVQYGFQVKGENVWITDVAPFGEVVIGTVPEPASMALLGLGGLAIAGRRRG